MEEIQKFEVNLEATNWNGDLEAKTMNLLEKEGCMQFLKKFFEDDLWGEHCGLIWDSEHGFTDDSEEKYELVEQFMDWDSESGPEIIIFNVDRDLALVNWDGGSLNRAMACNRGFAPFIKPVYRKHCIFTFPLDRDKVYVFNTKKKTITGLRPSEANLFITALTGYAPSGRKYIASEKDYGDRVMRPRTLTIPV
jgi:hypothetical protein